MTCPLSRWPHEHRSSDCIVHTVLTSIVLGLAWIFLPDQLLTVFIDINALVWLSTTKGVFFVLASGACFANTLHAVPTPGVSSLIHDQALLDALTTGPSRATGTVEGHHRLPWFGFLCDSERLSLYLLADDSQKNICRMNK